MTIDPTNPPAPEADELQGDGGETLMNDPHLRHLVKLQVAQCLSELGWARMAHCTDVSRMTGDLNLLVLEEVKRRMHGPHDALLFVVGELLEPGSKLWSLVGVFNYEDVARSHCFDAKRFYARIEIDVPIMELSATFPFTDFSCATPTKGEADPQGSDSTPAGPSGPG